MAAPSVGLRAMRSKSRDVAISDLAVVAVDLANLGLLFNADAAIGLELLGRIEDALEQGRGQRRIAVLVVGSPHKTCRPHRPGANAGAGPSTAQRGGSCISSGSRLAFCWGAAA
jgi:hypothetical protein